jgi:hypothetical protein
MSRKAMISGVDKMTWVGGYVFSGSKGSETESDIEADDWEWRADDGAAGGKAEAMAQKGHDGSAPGRRGGMDMLWKR